ncbi:general substrate transporter [Ascodesmis nigricans]|uniref:General substrate transporter n=1 Tax=Ascodesmis nigricans TaxID=341454 RepID=A0A4S2MPG8_9PEZI|nr:general substrate transporter [Ascodesmis nigricans]
MSENGGLERIESPVTARGYFLCGFAAFGGILFGYDSGYINGVLGMDYFKREFGHPTTLDNSGYNIKTWEKSLITSILSAGTFCGALAGGSVADWIGRRLSIMIACAIFSAGVVLQVASTTVEMLVCGRVLAGFGVGLVSAIVIMYMSEIAPKAIRGAIVSGYQWAITIGLLLASCVNQGTHEYDNSGSYRIPIAIQWLWAIILGVGLFFLPESPRWFVKKGRHEEARYALSRIRGQPSDSDYIKDELAEIQANYEFEANISKATWFDCFKGLGRSGNFRRVLIGVFLQMFQQWTGINFIFYYGTTFFQTSGISNAFLISLITNLVNVLTTPLSFWMIERFGRRSILIGGAALMLVCEFIIAAVGTALPGSSTASTILIVFVCIYIFGFATTWGPAAWVVIGEIFPLPIRAKGVALSTASNWLWNFVIGYITPYMVDPGEGNLQAKVFFVWGSTCTLSLLFAYFFVPETKGLSLEQVDQMMAESTARTSAKWKPHETYGQRMRRETGAAAAQVTDKHDATGEKGSL